MTTENLEKELIITTRLFLTETGSHLALRAVNINSHFERDLGIDSLGKLELVHRIENKFHIQLKEKIIANAETLADLLIAIDTTTPILNNLKKEFISSLTATEINLQNCTTLIDILKQYAVYEPERPHIYLQDEDGKEDIITYGQLYDTAVNIASGLISRGIKSGETVAIMLPTCKEFFFVFFGILLSGAIPVPIYPPFRADRIEEYAKREAKILQNAEIRLLITFARAEILSGILKNFIPSLTAVVTADSLLNSKAPLPVLAITEEHPVLIQYTSGSTGDPKGVLLLHKNMLANIHSIGKAIKLHPTDVGVSWLPLYHDMGLMSWLASLYFGMPITIMSPLTFLSHPEKWLWAIHYHRATLSAGPNFAYELCVKKIPPELIEGLDLSCWRLAFNGAEAVNVETLQRFAKKFQSYGFSDTALFPVYGLAENTVALTFPQHYKGLLTDKILKNDFENLQIATPAENSTDYFEFACCGEPIPDHDVRIVDDNGVLLPERHIGNLQFRGPSAMQGYYRNFEASQKIYHEGWWESGDLAYLVANDVYITGRKKDLIIKAGRNYHPEAIEAIINQIRGIRKGCVAAFGVTDKNSGTEKLIVVAETATQEKDEIQKIESEIIEQLAINLGTAADEVIFVAPKIIPKTSSGKLQRAACKQAYLNKQLMKKRAPVYWQMSKLFVSGQMQRFSQLRKKFRRFFYSLYVWLLLGLSIIPLWFLTAVLPKNRAKKLVHDFSKLFFKLIGCKIKIIGKENLFNQNAIFLANHSSYSDILILSATLPDNVSYIAKKELNRNFFLRTFIKKLDHLLVDRFDFTQNIADTKLIAQYLLENKSILIFPEGTFSYASGLRPFKNGAFQLAVDTEKPICPIAIKGARKFLRSGSFLLNLTTIEVTIGELLIPSAKDWSEVNRLKNLARDFIANNCGEASLDIISIAPILRE